MEEFRGSDPYQEWSDSLDKSLFVFVESNSASCAGASYVRILGHDCKVVLANPR